MPTKKKPMAETPEAQIAAIEKGIKPIIVEGENIIIKTPEDVALATEFLSKVKGYTTRINETLKFFTEPYIEQRRVALENKNKIEAMFEPKLSPLHEIMTKVKRAISDYTLEQEKKARAEEDRLQKIRDAANAKRVEVGKDVILEPVKTVERAPVTVKSDAGKMTTKKVWKFEINYLAELHNDQAFMMELFRVAVTKDLHEQVLRGMVSRGVRAVKGVRIYEDIDVSVSAKK